MTDTLTVRIIVVALAVMSIIGLLSLVWLVSVAINLPAPGPAPTSVALIGLVSTIAGSSASILGTLLVSTKSGPPPPPPVIPPVVVEEAKAA